MMFFLKILLGIAWAYGAAWTYTMMVEKDVLEEGVQITERMTTKERALASILVAVAWPYFLYLLEKDARA